MADNPHALLDTMIAYRTALRSSARQLTETIAAAPAELPADVRLLGAMHACAIDIRDVAETMRMAMDVLDGRLSQAREAARKGFSAS